MAIRASRPPVAVIGARAKGATAKTKTNKNTMKHIPKPQPRFSRLERLKKSIGRKACLIALLLAVPLAQVPAQQVSNPAASPADAKTVDAGDSYTADGHVFKLKRIANQIVVKNRTGANRFKQDSVALAGARTLRRTVSLRDDLAVWQDDATGTDDAARLAGLLNAAKADPETDYAFPVYLVEGHNLHLYGGDELVLQLKSGTSRETFEQLLLDQRLSVVKPVEKFEDTYIVRLFNPKRDDGLAAVTRLMAHPDVEWAEHHFLQEVRSSITPSDGYFGTQQWHLHNSANFGADYNANIKAPNAWTGPQLHQTYGSAGVVVAVLDDGVQTDHPDLAARIRPGYDFRSGDNDPSPATILDNHGTAVAGMVAASANGSGSVGAAPNVRILPVRMMIGGGDQVPAQTIVDAVTWAADNADILNCSWKTPPHSLITAAFSYAATSGRGGKGAIVTAASGNGASKWAELSDGFQTGVVVPAGTWRYRFVMDSTYEPEQTSRAHIAFVRFPNGTVERFDNPGIPSGWTSINPSLPWSSVEDLTRSHGVGRYFLASAPLLPGAEDSIVTTPSMTHGTAARLKLMLFITNPNNSVQFRVQGSSDDGVTWQALGGTAPYAWGVTSPNPTIDYPASLTTTIAVGASTDWDYRSDYSNYTVDGNYGGILDFVAPSGGGYMDVFTTDRTGSAGYNTFSGSQDYAFVSGTSFASPIAAGVAALVLSRNGHLTATQVRDVMRGSAEKVKSGIVNYVDGHSTYFGYGRLDAAAAVAAAMTAATPDTTVPTLDAVSVQTTRSIDVTFSEPMGGGVYSTLPPGFPNPAYTISGTGRGTLQDRPSSVIRLSPTKYRLVWPIGGMVNGTVTLTVTSPMDVAGNLASSSSLNSTGTTAIQLVNCGGSTVYPYGSGDPRTPWLPNSYWLGNQFVQYTTSGSSGSTSSSVNTSGVSSPAPQAVYQSGRMRWYADGTPAQWLTYNLSGLLPGEYVKVRLHFSEMYWSNIGDQIFNIRVNNSNPANYPNYWDYDILGATGGYNNTARVLEFNLAHTSGPLRIDLEQRPSSGQSPYYNATINGIEVLRQ